MKLSRFYVTQEELDKKCITNDDCRHSINVLRLKEGSFLLLFSNDEFDYQAQIISISKSAICFKIKDKEKNTSNPSLNISLFQALAKGDKLELVTQKATELGASSLNPFCSKNCTVKQHTTKVDRLEKIMTNACRQCGRSKLMQINKITSFDLMLTNLKAFDMVFFANETQKDNHISEILSKYKNHKNIAIIVGPEGGFADDEISSLIALKNVQNITLGKRILRTETAGLYMLSIINDITKN